MEVVADISFEQSVFGDQIDVGRHTSRAVERLLHLHAQRVDRLESQLDDPHLPERELAEIAEQGRVVSDGLTPVSNIDPALAELAVESSAPWAAR